MIKNIIPLYGLAAMLLLATTVLFPGCNRHGFDDSVKLEFSTDTLMFDTVFTTVTSITRNFTVKNPSKNPVKLDILRQGQHQPHEPEYALLGH